MPQARPSEAPKVPRGKWVRQLHRRPVRWDVLLHKLAEAIARRYWHTQVHFRQEILKLETDELWDAAMQMARAFGKQTTFDAIATDRQNSRRSIFALEADNMPLVIDAATEASISALINYLEIVHNCFLKRNHQDLLLLKPRIAETFRRFFSDKCSPDGDLRPCLQDPLASDEGYFAASESLESPPPPTGEAALDAYHANITIGDDDDAPAVMRKLIAYAKSDPYLAPEFAVEIVTKLTARQLHAAKTKQKLNQAAEAIHVRDHFLFSPCRQGGLQPVRLFLNDQLFASEQQKLRLDRWAAQQTDGVFRVISKGGDGATLRDVSSDREIVVKGEALLEHTPEGTLIRARVLPWDDHWLISGTVQVIDQASGAEPPFKAILHPLRVRRWADENQPRLLKAREFVRIIHGEFIEQFGKAFASFASLEHCRKALAQLHHHLTMELKLSDGRQFTDAWKQDVGMDFPSFIEEQFAAGESNLTTPGIVYDQAHGMAFLPNSAELLLAMTSPCPSVTDKQAFARVLLEKWRPSWIIQRLAAEYPDRLQDIARELLGDPAFSITRDLEPLLGRVKCPDHTLPSRPVPFLVA